MCDVQPYNKCALTVSEFFVRRLQGPAYKEGSLSGKVRVGQSHAYLCTYLQCVYSVFSRDISVHAVVYGVNIQFWPTLGIVQGVGMWSKLFCSRVICQKCRAGKYRVTTLQIEILRVKIN